jgi:hypothetical protein
LENLPDLRAVGLLLLLELYRGRGDDSEEEGGKEERSVFAPSPKIITKKKH